MILYFDNLGKLNTILPHGEIPRQGGDLKLIVLVSNNIDVSNKTILVRFRYFGKTIFSSDNFTGNKIEYTYNEIIGETANGLINGKTYAGYEVDLSSSGATDLPGDLEINCSLVESDNENVLRTIQLGNAKIFIEETLGFESDKGLGMTASEYENLLARYNEIDVTVAKLKAIVQHMGQPTYIGSEDNIPNENQGVLTTKTKTGDNETALKLWIWNSNLNKYENIGYYQGEFTGAFQSVTTGEECYLDFVTQADYDTLVKNSEVRDNCYYFITDDTTIDELIANLKTENFATKEYVDNAKSDIREYADSVYKEMNDTLDNRIVNINHIIETKIDSKLIADEKLQNLYNSIPVEVGDGEQSVRQKYNGNSAIASGENSAAFGGKRYDKLTDTSKTPTSAEGAQSFAAGGSSHAVGEFSVAMGKEAVAYQKNSVALGNKAVAGDPNNLDGKTSSVAMGYSTVASGDYSFAMGNQAKASADGSIAFGRETEASNLYSAASGYKTKASGAYSSSHNRETIASGENSHAEGNLTVANTNSSHAEGYGTLAGTEEQSSIEHTISGGGSSAISNPSEGDSTNTGEYSHAEGALTRATGSFSHAEGYSTKATNHASHAEGRGTKATGAYSHTEGLESTASAEGAHAEGNQTNASGKYAHAEGAGTKASGYYSHTEGSGTLASGDYTHAGGVGSKATAKISFASGWAANASGIASFATGRDTEAKGDNSFVAGYHNTASGTSQTVVGQFNATDNDAYFIVGNGDESGTSNALTVKKDGVAEIGVVDFNNNKSVVNVSGLKNYNKSFANKNEENLFNENVTFAKDVYIRGTTYTVEEATNVVKANYIVTNSEGKELTSTSGLLVRANPTDTYGITYNKDENGVALGIGTYNSDGSFSFNETNPGLITTRDSASNLNDNHILKWNSTLTRLVDSGKTVDDFVVKLNTQTVIYATNSSGEDISLKYSQKADRSSIAMRNSLGQLFVADPTEDTHAATKKYVDDTSVAKTKTPNIVYATSDSGEQIHKEISVLNNPWSFVMRNDNNQFQVGYPTDDLHATNKQYVDEIVSKNITENSAIIPSTGEGSAAQKYGSYSAVASGENAVALGGKRYDKLNDSERTPTSAEGKQSFAQGGSSHAYGDFSIAMGKDAEAYQKASISIGGGTIAGDASGDSSEYSYAFATGELSKATSRAAFASGISTLASGLASHAEGNKTVASGEESHAEGYNTKATGIMSHTEGLNSVASGKYSHAGGVNSVASGNISFAQGDGVKATGRSQTVVGQYNVTDSTAYFIVGNGEPGELSNAFVVKKDGVAEITKVDLENEKSAVNVGALSNYVDLSSEQNINGLKTFKSIKLQSILATSGIEVIYTPSNGNSLTLGRDFNLANVTLRGGKQPKWYDSSNYTTKTIAMVEDINSTISALEARILALETQLQEANERLEEVLYGK